ncbi:glycosyltransferase family 2 protein [Pseudomonas sp. CK-NBRI-02]|uniref:glycosyltransferase n=1 Tax=Pseudomonas sp. CK-NBRI-02 TaxID=2249759 RepID=UPI0009B7A3C7|nr:glycosyltransferase family A protein [Pseudomonas sp. CK-NBRI-02]TYO75953.1 glycosyltransferase family 2 protein [Pseudomonas sp. CK-NBRI-02]
MIGVVIPAHNEARRLGHCLRAVKRAALEAERTGRTVQILVVLDRCNDASAAIAFRHGVATLAVDAGNVGIARRTDAAWMLERGAQWLAFTDADSRVPAHWLLSQLQGLPGEPGGFGPRMTRATSRTISGLATKVRELSCRGRWRSLRWTAMRPSFRRPCANAWPVFSPVRLSCHHRGCA